MSFPGAIDEMICHSQLCKEIAVFLFKLSACRVARTKNGCESQFYSMSGTCLCVCGVCLHVCVHAGVCECVCVCVCVRVVCMSKV